MPSQPYYVNKKEQANGDHEVHVRECNHFPRDYNYLGVYEDCQSAIKAAKKTFDQVNGCVHCCKECHTS